MLNPNTGTGKAALAALKGGSSATDQVWVAAETGRVCYTEADLQKMKAGLIQR